MSGRRPDDEAHGLSPREWAIMDRHDDGLDTKQIASELDLSPAYVWKITTMYSGSWSQNKAFDAMVRAGSIALASAIARTGKAFS